ncbi:MAG TPA: FlgD immunoglobulin-like domain containing protein [bacterium]|nr:FlgD immunoglobulin-like domain containing protein [bacterium]
MPNSDPPRSASRFAVVVAALLAALCAAPDARAAAVHSLTGEQVYSLALHVHGSFSESSGSMEWQADQAQQAGVDFLWWTDHDWRLARVNHTRGTDFETAFLDLALNRIEQPDDAYPGEELYWEATGSFNPTSFTVVDSVAFEGAQSLRYSMEESFPGGLFSPGSYLLQSASLFQNTYSVAAQVKLAFALFPESFDATNARFAVEVSLSDHPGGTPALRYVVGSMEGEPASSIPLIHTPGTWNQFELDVLGDAVAAYSAGGADSLRVLDNSLVSVRIGLETRNGHIPVVFFDDYRILSDSTLTGDDLLDTARDIGQYYEPIYTGVGHFFGSEISRFRAQPHMNAFAPGHVLVDYGNHVFSDSLYYAIDQVHAQGGLVSLNHHFGTGVYADTTETEANKNARVQFAKVGLIGNRMYGADILEVGYRIRGGIDLPRFVDLWDALNANTVYVTGTGVTDTHGPFLFNGWGPHLPGDGNFENNFVTWVYAPGPAETELLAALGSGRAFFGDPWIFQGTLDVVTPEGFRMGQVVLTDRAAQDVIVDVTGAPIGTEVRLLQIEQRDNPPAPYTTGNVLRDEILAAPVGGVLSDTVTVDTSLSSYVRVELSTPGDGTWAFSNPLHLVRSIPTAGIPSERFGARVNTASILRTSEFETMSASFLPGPPPTLFITGLESAPGLGEIVIDPGLLGQPTAVLGAVSWEYVDGVIRLQNFGGSTTLVLGWSPVGVPDAGTPVATELSLEPARPNPFGAGISTAFTLPRAGYATLEVFDVRGRRVRRLLRDWMEAGRHAATWDGKNDGGAAVADGVYVLRLEAGGRKITTKAVKVR